MSGCSILAAACCCRCVTLTTSGLSAVPRPPQADICAEEGALPFLVKTLTYESPTKSSAVAENGGGILRNVSSHVAVREDYRSVHYGRAG